MFLTDREQRDVTCEDHPDFERVTSAVVDAQGRWINYYSQVFEHTPTGTYWEFLWSRGATEVQDEGPEDITYGQVKPIQKVRTEYVHMDSEEKGNVAHLYATYAVSDEAWLSLTPEQAAIHDGFLQRNLAQALAEEILKTLPGPHRVEKRDHKTIHIYELKVVR